MADTPISCPNPIVALLRPDHFEWWVNRPFVSPGKGNPTLFPKPKSISLLWKYSLLTLSVMCAIPTFDE